MKIKDMCPDERPREKLRLRGTKALSNAELLAILIGSGTEGKNVMDVAQELLAICEGRLALLSSFPMEKLVEQKGVGAVRAVTICAALELGRRSFEENAVLDKVSITSPDMVFRLMLPELKGLDHEESWVIYLNRAHFVLGKELITVGSMESVQLDTTRILKRSIEKQCSHVILVHNHPTGDPNPSTADITQTEHLRKILRAIELPLMDHVIIADDSYYSFAEELCVTPGRLRR